MKKLVAANWAIVVSIVLVTFVLVTADANAQFLSRTLSLRDLAFQLKTPEAITRYMWHNFAVEKDQRQFGVEDYWQSPEEMLANQKGDCEDFAVFAYQMLKANGIKAFLLNIYGDRFAHTVCVFKENGKLNVIDGTQVQRFESQTLNDVAYQIHPFWKEAAVVIPVPGTHQAKVLERILR